MSLNESTVEDAALEWFGELVPRSREVEHGPQLAAGESVAHDGGRDLFSEVVMVGRLREAELNALTHRDYADPGEVLIRHTLAQAAFFQEIRFEDTGDAGGYQGLKRI